MEYLATNNRLYKSIFKFLDIKLTDIELRKDAYGGILFIFPNEQYGLLGWRDTSILGISHKLVEQVQKMFDLEKDYIYGVIGRYIEDRYKLEVNDTFLFNQFIIC
jgi:hypothetical protein